MGTILINRKNHKDVCLNFLLLIVTFFITFNYPVWARSLDDTEFEYLTDSKVFYDSCDQVQLNEMVWSDLVREIKLELNVEKYLKDILKKARVAGVAGKTANYRKMKISFNGINCKFKGEYRLTGDMLDHIGLVESGVIPHSIKIKLKTGRIGNILKFKLFVPGTRKAEKEILNVLIHQRLGIIAPRSALVNVQIGGQKYKALFQEDITKEILEDNNFHEAVLLEGDEGYSPFTNPKIINPKFVANSHFREIAKDILEMVGKVYHYTSNAYIKSYEPNKSLIDLPLFIDLLPNDSKDHFSYYHLLNFALKSSGGLSRDDSRMFYDHISRQFFPIYYDGDISSVFPDFSIINFEISEETKEKLIRDLKSISIVELRNELKNYGALLSQKQLVEFILSTVSYIERVPYKTPNIDISQTVEGATNEILTLGQKLLYRDHPGLEKMKISWISNKQKLKSCLIFKNRHECKMKNMDDDSLSYNFEPQSLDGNIFLHGFESKVIDQAYFHSMKKNKIFITGTGTIIEHTDNISVSIDYEDKTIKVGQKDNSSSTAQVKLSEGTLDNWNLIVEKDVKLGYSKVEGSRASEFGLTGCITFNDISFTSLKIIVPATKCEDAVHFVRASGDLHFIDITNSESDAVDADFSNLFFHELNVTDAGNDCTDFSAGNYQIKKGKLRNCGDKGISAGESSKVSIDTIEINNALIGVVSKDGSIVLVDQAKIYETKLCLAVYRKKQEYGGGHLSLNTIDCPSNIIYKQKYSYLNIPN